MRDSSSAKVGLQFKLTPEQALLVLPILGGVAISLLVAIGGLYPLLPMLQEQEERLKLYQEQRDELPLLRRRLLASDDQYLKLQAQQLNLISLASSTDQLDTILTTINRIARQSGLQIVSVEPEKKSLEDKGDKPKSNKKNKKKGDKASDVVPALTENELFQSQSYQLSLSGSYVALQQFLVGLESLQTAVLLSDLDLSSATGSDSEASKSPASSQGNLALKFRLVVLKRAQDEAAEDKSPRAKRDDVDLLEDF